MEERTRQIGEGNLLPHDGEAFLVPGFFDTIKSDEYLQRLVADIPWKQEPIKIFGRTVMQPRLTAWYGDEGKVYSYSGITLQPRPWTAALVMIRQEVEKEAGLTFNSALLNLYRDGRDSMGWHRDNERELGVNPVIASVSLGASRMFQFRYHKDKSEVIKLELTNGSLLLMKGATQHHWEHALPKTGAASGLRINITFRIIT